MFAYDAENRLIGLNVGNMESVSYQYDADGKRVQKTENGTTTYVYDAMELLAAEYSTQASTDNGTTYMTRHALGSTRLLTAGSGTSGTIVKKRYNYAKDP